MTIHDTGPNALPRGFGSGPGLIEVPPPTVGYYVLGDLWFGLTYKPFWLHRFGVRLVLGWRWKKV